MKETNSAQKLKPGDIKMIPTCDINVLAQVQLNKIS